MEQDSRKISEDTDPGENLNGIWSAIMMPKKITLKKKERD